MATRSAGPTVLAREQPTARPASPRRARLRRARRRGRRTDAGPSGARRGARQGVRPHSRHPAHGARAWRRTHRRRAALAGDRVAYAQGVDRSQDRATTNRSKAPSGRIRCRSPMLAATRASSPSSSDGCRATSRKRCSTSVARSCASSHRSRRRATGAWARTRTRTAVVSFSRSTIPDFRRYAVDVPRPATVYAGVDASNSAR